MDRYTNMLSQMLEEVGPRDAWSFQADLSLILYTLQQDEGILKAASQSGQWADMVRICARQVYDLPSDHRQPLENLSETCSAILRTLLQNLAQDQQLLCQNAAALLDELLQQMIDRKYTSDLIPPRSLADMMAAMAVPQAPCRILDPVCGSSRLLLAACGINHAAELLGIARSESIAAAALLRLRLGGIENGHVERADFFSRVPHLAERFDVILANPPYDKDLRDTFRYIYAFLNLLKPDGRCAVLVPEGLLNNTTSQDAVELRDFLLHCHDLEAVVSLPLRIYWPRGPQSRAAGSILPARHGSDPAGLEQLVRWKAVAGGHGISLLDSFLGEYRADQGPCSLCGTVRILPLCSPEAADRGAGTSAAVPNQAGASSASTYGGTGGRG